MNELYKLEQLALRGYSEYNFQKGYPHLRLNLQTD